MSEARYYYDSGSLHIAGYDSIYAPLPEALDGDIAFYAGLVGPDGQPVLEIGCGTGRVALALAADGIETVGIDAAEDMLAAARAKCRQLPPASRGKLDLRQADMRDFTLDRSFGTVLVPFRTFHLLLDDDEQQRCLGAIHRHMKPGARLALHLFDPPPDVVARAKEPLLATERGIDAVSGGPIIARAGACLVDEARQIRREIWHYCALDENGATLREQRLELAIRWLWPEQTRALLQHAGFVVEAQYGDFHGGGPRRGGEQIWVARKS